MSSDAIVVTVSVIVGVAIVVIFEGLIFMGTEARDQEYVPPPKAVPTHLHPPYQPVHEERNEIPVHCERPGTDDRGNAGAGGCPRIFRGTKARGAD